MNCKLCGGDLPSPRALICRACRPRQAVLRAQAWYAANRERKRSYDAARRQNRDYWRAIAKRHRNNNPDTKRIDTNVRRRRHRQATPGWVNRFFIAEIYALAALRTAVTGKRWHVDHVIPLKNDLVCGLHVHENLRVVPAEVNLSKHNRYEVVP